VRQSRGISTATFFTIRSTLPWSAASFDVDDFEAPLLGECELALVSRDETTTLQLQSRGHVQDIETSAEEPHRASRRQFMGTLEHSVQIHRCLDQTPGVAIFRYMVQQLLELVVIDELSTAQQPQGVAELQIMERRQRHLAHGLG
jgi:hypothetical protein